MTKLNITNKTIYKLKKNKNQSKKKAPKKRKHGKRKHKNGRSFRKRRRKYNIKNNSIKKRTVLLPNIRDSYNFNSFIFFSFLFSF